jgi:hypothetical protein
MVEETLAEHGRQALFEPEDQYPVNVTRPTSSGNSVDLGTTSSPSMSLRSGIISPLPSTRGSSRHYRNPTYLADDFSQAYNPYTDNQAQHRRADPRLNYPGRMPNSSVQSGSGAGGVRPQFLGHIGHSQNDSMGSNEPLLPGSDIDASVGPPVPFVPHRSPLRMVGGAGNMHGGVGGRVNRGSWNDESASDRYNDDDQHGALRTGSLRVRSRVVDLIQLSDFLPPILGSKQPGLISPCSNNISHATAGLLTCTLITKPFSLNSGLFAVLLTGMGDYIFLYPWTAAVPLMATDVACIYINGPNAINYLATVRKFL